ncbi:MAG: helix-turn-helix domain-containing protein [Pseudomonadota bacterium]
MSTSETYSLAMGTEVCCRILGIDPSAMLDKAGLQHLTHRGNELRVTAAQYFDAWNAVAALAGRPDFITHLGVNIARGPVIPVFFALSCAPNFDTGSLRLSHFKSLLGPTRMLVYRDRTGLRVEYISADVHLEVPPSLGALHLVYLVEAVRLATSHPVSPISAALNADEEERRQIAGHLGVLPDYGHAASLTYSLEDAKRPFISENPRLWEDFERDLEQQLAAQRSTGSLAAQVRATLISLFPSSRANAEDVCFTLGVSRSTLQRGLRREATSFQTILDETRQELALRYLTKSTLAVGEIASLLGYRDANSFSRSFRRWTGRSPVDYRQVR